VEDPVEAKEEIKMEVDDPEPLQVSEDVPKVIRDPSNLVHANEA